MIAGEFTSNNTEVMNNVAKERRKSHKNHINSKHKENTSANGN